MRIPELREAAAYFVGWSRAEFELFVQKMMECYDMGARQVRLTQQDASEAARMVEMALDMYEPGTDAPRQTSMKLGDR